MRRALAYCGFRHDASIALPAEGVHGAPIQVASDDALRVLWSEVEWPFDAAALQKNAVEFHTVVSHIFQQTAVIPFRLLSVFDDARALHGFTAEHQEHFLADLNRLKDSVQMECVVYPAPAQRFESERNSGADYLRQKAELVHGIEDMVRELQGAVAHLSREVRVREAKSGTRVFVLVERGREMEFREAVKRVELPAHLSRRSSGPWPAAEFLSEVVKAPQIAGAK